MMMLMMLMTRGLVLMLRKVDDGFGAESNVRGIRTEDGGRFTSTHPVHYIEIHNTCAMRNTQFYCHMYMHTVFCAICNTQFNCRRYFHVYTSSFVLCHFLIICAIVVVRSYVVLYISYCSNH